MRKSVIAILAFLCFPLMGVAQDYERMWTEVESLKAKGLPRSAMSVVEKILRKAERKVDFAWETKAKFELMKLRVDVCPDSLSIDVENFCDELKGVKSKSDEMVLRALLGEAYRVMAHHNRNNKDLADECKRKSKEQFELSLSDWNVLADASADDYKPLMMILGNDDDSRLYGDDMLHVLAVYKVLQSEMPNEEKCELYDSLSSYYFARGNRNAALLTKIEALTWLRRLNEWPKRLTLEAYKDSVLVLARSNRDIEAGADAYKALVSTMNDYDERRAKLDVIDEALAVYPNSVHRAFFERTRAEQNRGHVSANIINGSYDPVKVVVEHEGVDGCRISFYHHGKKRMEAVRDLFFDDGGDERHTDTLLFVLTPGNYRMKLEYGEVSDTTNVNVSSMYMVAASYPGDNNIITVLDGNSGRPLENVRLSVRNRKGELKEAKTTDEYGQAFVVGKEFGLKVIADAGNYDKTEIGYMKRWDFGEDLDEQKRNVSLFSDRAVYRPGQTANVAVIAYAQTGDETLALKDKELTLALHDTKGKEVDRKTVRTNAMGSASANFELPKECMPGVYVVKADGRHDLALRVEEYRRPTFDVKLAVEQTGYALGDTVQVCGKAMTFSGMPVQNAKVRYRVEFRNLGFWHRYNASWGTVANGTLDTDEKGRFDVLAYLDPNKMDSRFRLLEFRVTAEVVSGAGETQQGECRMVVSPNSFGLTAEVPSVIVVGEDADICVKAMNLVGKEVEVECEYRIFSRQNGKLVDKGRTRNNVTLSQGLVPGDYRIEFAATDKIKDFATGGERVDTIRAEADFALFDPMAKTMDVTKDFMYSAMDEIDEEHHADIYFMPEHRNVALFWMLVAGDSIIDKGVRHVENDMQKFHVEYKKEYGGRVALNVFYVKDFKLHSRKKDLTLAKPDMRLDIRWKTFRDRLVPGQQEVWTLDVSDSRERPVSAELLATMYDASLDKIAPHKWIFDVNFVRRETPISMVGSLAVFGNCRLITDIPAFDVRGRSFDRLIDWEDGMALNEVFVAKLSSAPMRSKALHGRIAGLDTSTDGVVTEESADGGAGELRAVRSDFAETAFFYPHIMTNKKGEAAISFTLPESMTEWRFKGLVHTADMKYGQIEGRAVASKDFMVQPNMPRFVRVGDKATIATSVVNRRKGEVKGVVTMTLMDAETEVVVMKESRDFVVAAEQTSVVDFGFEPTGEHPMLVCQIEAGNNDFSDGERRFLPVLSNKQLITTTVPFFLEGGEEKTVNIANVFNDGSETATGHKLTIEYNGSPAWMAVEALKSVAVPDVDNAVSVSASLYANLAAEHIAEALDGKFDLDSVADLLDKNNMDIRKQKAEEKLRKLQKDDGSWSWFEGMAGNRHITTTIVEHIAEAENLTGKECALHDAMLKGMAWLDDEELKRYERMKETNGCAGVPSENTLRYLYVSSLVERDMDSAVVAMQREYIDKVERMTNNLTIYGRANIACVLDKWGRKERAREFVNSLREYTVSKGEMGRYYDTDKAQYSWCDYRMPTHLAAMKAMRQQSDSFADSSKYINEMTLWIIQQKRTQDWGNAIITVGAVNELLCNNMLGNRNVTNPKFDIDGRMLAEKERVEGVSDLQDVKVLRIVPADKGTGVSWGAVFGQCVEDIDKIENSSTDAISINRKMYVERVENGASSWKEVGEGDVLKVGDKVRVRYTLATDRDMDFVQVKAQLPACFEPENQLSGYRWFGGCGAYVAQHDASSDFFFNVLRKGSITFDQIMHVSRDGKYESGIVTAKCAYSPEFSARTCSIAVDVAR